MRRIDITALSTPISQANLSERVGVAVLKMAIDNVQKQNQSIVQILETTTKAMELSIQPHLGSQVDDKL